MKLIIFILKFPFAILLQIGHTIGTWEVEYTVLKEIVTKEEQTAKGGFYIEKRYMVYPSLYQYIMHRYPEPQITIKHTQFIKKP